MISIITPVLNGDKYIEHCLNTIISQISYSKKKQLEHLIIDGGSKDKTLSIVKKYAAKHSHIRVISRKNLNQSAAMNLGISKAKGDIISFLNVDDYYEAGIIAFIQKLFIKLPKNSFVVGNSTIINDKNEKIWYNMPSKLTLSDVLIPNQIPMNGTNYFYHKSLHEIVGVYDENNESSMDIDFILRVVQKAYIKYIPMNFGFFRLHSDSKTFIGLSTGKQKSELSLILKKYQKDLSISQKMLLPIRQLYYHNMVTPIKVFMRKRNIIEFLKNLFDTTPYYLRGDKFNFSDMLK